MLFDRPCWRRMEIDWPHDRMNVYILDDGRRAGVPGIRRECGAGYLTRTDNAHAKAGNINAALKKHQWTITSRSSIATTSRPVPSCS